MQGATGGVTLADLMTEMRSMRSDLQGYQKKVNELRSHVDTEIDPLTTENRRITGENDSLRCRLGDVKSYARRKNCVVYGLVKDEQSALEEASKLLTGKLDIQHKLTFTATWLSRGKGRAPLLIEFGNVEERKLVFDAATRRLGKDGDTRVKPDIPPAWRTARRKLSKFYNEAMEKNLEVRVVNDFLVVSGEQWTYDEGTQSIRQVKGYKAVLKSNR